MPAAMNQPMCIAVSRCGVPWKPFHHMLGKHSRKTQLMTSALHATLLYLSVENRKLSDPVRALWSLQAFTDSCFCHVYSPEGLYLNY